MSENKKYYWLKLKDDFFRQREIKKLRKIAGGDTYTVIYLKMMLLSLVNDCKIYFEGVEDTFIEELALELDEEVDNVKVTVMFLIKNRLLEEISENEFFLTYAKECTGSETSSAARVRRFRDKQKALQCNTDVTNCNTEKEKEIEKEIEIEKREKRIDYQQIADMYNDTCASFPKCTTLSDKRKKAIKARLNTYTVEDFKRLFELAEESNFLKGKNNRNWSATFDWLIQDSNMAKVLDGNYSQKGELNGTDKRYSETPTLGDVY